VVYLDEIDKDSIKAMEKLDKLIKTGLIHDYPEYLLKNLRIVYDFR